MFTAISPLALKASTVTVSSAIAVFATNCLPETIALSATEIAENINF